MGVNAREEQYEHVKLFGKPALFTDSRIDRSTVPTGFYCYDLRGSDRDPGKPVVLENQVVVNHAGTVLTTEPVTIPKEGLRRLRGKLNFIGECLTLSEFCEEHGLELKVDNGKLNLRPASSDKAGLFFALSKEQDAKLATIGHLRIDFGSNGHEFWHAQYQLGKLYLQREDIPKKVDAAVKWFTASAEQGNQFAQYHLGKLYLLGHDVPRDREAAVRWLTLSAEQGNIYAQFFLEHLDSFRDPSLFLVATRLLHHMSRIFREKQEQLPTDPNMQVESKLRRKIRQKKIAQGHAPDDHEQRLITY